jgi:hypothetical protein
MKLVRYSTRTFVCLFVFVSSFVLSFVCLLVPSFVSSFFRSFGRLFVLITQTTLLLPIVVLLSGGLHDGGDSFCGVLGYYSLLYSHMRVLKFKRDTHLLLHVLASKVEAASFHKMVVLKQKTSWPSLRT